MAGLAAFGGCLPPVGAGRGLITGPGAGVSSCGPGCGASSGSRPGNMAVEAKGLRGRSCGGPSEQGAGSGVSRLSSPPGPRLEILESGPY